MTLEQRPRGSDGEVDTTTRPTPGGTLSTTVPTASTTTPARTTTAQRVGCGLALLSASVPAFVVDVPLTALVAVSCLLAVATVVLLFSGRSARP